MKPLSERDENKFYIAYPFRQVYRLVGMKPLSERDENTKPFGQSLHKPNRVGMKPLSERDENCY